MSTEAKARISASLRQSYASGQRKAHIDKAIAIRAEQWRGRHHEQSARLKVSLFQKGRAKSDQTRQRMSISAQRTRSTRRSLAILSWQSLTEAQRMDRLAGIDISRMSPDQAMRRAELSAASWKTMSPDERRHRMRGCNWRELPSDVQDRIKAANRAAWERATPEERECRLKASRTKTSSLERIVSSLLDGLGIAYLSHVTIGRYVVDFLVPHRKLVIECDGEYWHSLPGVPEKDERKDRDLSSRGYGVLRLPGRLIKAGEAERLLLVATQA